MIKLQFKLPQTLISRCFTRRTVFHAPAFQQNQSIDGHLSDMEASFITPLQTNEPRSDHNFAMDMPAYQTHHQNYSIPASFSDCHVDFQRQVTINETPCPSRNIEQTFKKSAKKTCINNETKTYNKDIRKKSNSIKFQKKTKKTKRKTKNASKNKYNENMPPATVDVPKIQMKICHQQQ